jgi:N-methylhydantoinase B
MSGMVKEVDPISLQVIGGALHSIAEQMGNVLYRMSYSSIIRESQDLGAGLFDRDYNTLCESDSTPMHIGSLPGYLRGIEKTVPLDAWKPGTASSTTIPITAPATRPTSASSCRCSSRASL